MAPRKYRKFTWNAVELCISSGEINFSISGQSIMEDKKLATLFNQAEAYICRLCKLSLMVCIRDFFQITRNEIGHGNKTLMNHANNIQRSSSIKQKLIN